MSDEFGEQEEFNIKQFPQSAFEQDPDDVLRYTLELLNVERDEEEEILLGLLDLFDVDSCPEQYLPYLGDLIGHRVRASDPVNKQREQIKQAVSWYKAKGTPLSFVIILRAIGFVGRVYELWTDDIECKRWDEILPDPYYCSDIPSGWNPHSRIDLEVEVDLATFPTLFPGGFTEFFDYIVKHIEEVRPIHVLLRVINIILFILDQYPIELIHDELEVDVTGYIDDEWAGAYFGLCGIWHFAYPKIDIERDGGDYTWLRPEAVDRLDTPPPSPSDGERYLVGRHPTGAFYGHRDEIADRVTGTWVFTVPTLNNAIWVLSGTPPDEPTRDPGDWKAYYYDGVHWIVGWTLFQPRTRPGPYFRECQGLPGYTGVGPIDDLEIFVTWDSTPDPFAYCMYHDGGIPLRDGTHFRNCGITADALEINGIIAPEDDFPATGDAIAVTGELVFLDEGLAQNRWDEGFLWDNGLLWDEGVGAILGVDYLEIWITDHGSGQTYPATVQISGQ